jgi:hypothetical protein
MPEGQGRTFNLGGMLLLLCFQSVFFKAKSNTKAACSSPVAVIKPLVHFDCGAA